MIEMNKTTISVTCFIAFGLIILLIFPYSSENTIILQTSPAGGFDASCEAPNLVLAQNLTDLCDVTIISPATDEIIQYNGSQWVNTPTVTFTDTTTCTNIGSGTAYICVEGTNVDFRSILAGTGIDVSNDTDTVTITNTAPDNTSCANVGSGSPVYKDGECNFRTILGSPDISVTQQTDTVTIDYNGTLASESTVCSGQSGNHNIVASSSSGNCTFKNLVASTGIGLSNNATHITVTNSLPESTACTNLGTVGEGIYISGNCDFKKLLAGSGISLSSNGTRITITNTVTDTNACTNTGTGEAVCESANNINSLIAGTGVSIADTTGDLTITNTGVTSLTSADTTTLSLSDSTGAITITPTIQKLCETTASGGETSLTCTPSTAGVNNLMISIYLNATGADTYGIRMNADGGTNYTYRTSTNGAADATTVSSASMIPVVVVITQEYNINMQCSNPLSNDEKFCYGSRTTSVSGNNAPSRVEFVGKWANTANDITSIAIVRTAGVLGSLNAGSYIVVWGLN